VRDARTGARYGRRMESPSPARLEVWRRERKILEGSPEDVLRAAREGRVRATDRIAVPGRGERLPPHAFAELATLVPGAEEAALRRNLRSLLVVDAVVGAVALAGAALLLATEEGSLRAVLTAMLVVAVLFVAPVYPLRRRLRELRAARARGIVPGVTVPRTTGDAGLDALLRERPVATQALTALVVASSLAAFASPAWMEALMKVNARIAAGEWWRLVTVALVHGGLAHLAFNALALWSLGPLAEVFYGRARFLAIFLLGTALATMASMAYTDADGVGASGGVFAIVGAVLVFALRGRGVVPEPLRARLLRDMAWIVGVNLVFGFSVGYVDNAAHVGGLVGGAVVGAALGPRASLRPLVGRRR
jgi:membrane associated rhomboid family serine protease